MIDHKAQICFSSQWGQMLGTSYQQSIFEASIVGLISICSFKLFSHCETMPETFFKFVSSFKFLKYSTRPVQANKSISSSLLFLFQSNNGFAIFCFFSSVIFDLSL